jgi:elongation factor G
MKITVTVPEDDLGDVMGDINSKRGKVLGMEGEGTLRSVVAEVPMAEIQQYAAELRSLTSGRGSYEVEFDHFAEVPHHEAQQVIAAARSSDD